MRSLGDIAYGVSLGFLYWTSNIVAGIIIIAFKIPRQPMSLFNKRKSRLLRETIYVILAMVVASSALLITIRATTNLIHEQEQWLENFQYSNTPNLTPRGIVTGIALNYEVNTGYSYHIFPAYITERYRIRLGRRDLAKPNGLLI